MTEWTSLPNIPDAIPFVDINGKRGLRHPENLDVEYLVMPGHDAEESGAPFGAAVYHVPHGKNRHQDVDPNELLRAAHLTRYFGAMAQAHAIVNRRPINQVYNLGIGSNVTQEYIYRIISVDGATVTLRGVNPKRIPVQVVTLNENWWSDPENEPRLNVTTAHARLTPGACLRFLYPSVLHRKVVARIHQIHYPASNALEDVTFSVILDKSVANAMEADIEGAGQDGPKFVNISDYILAPEVLPEVQQSDTWETKVAPRIIELDVEDIPESGVYELLDHSENSTRVVKNGWMYPINQDAGLYVSWVQGGIPQFELGDAANQRLLVHQTSGGWESLLDLSDLKSSTDEIKNIRIQCVAEVKASDSPQPLQTPFVGACANCRQDRSGSLNDNGGWYCAASRNASLFSNFRAGCWQPECSRFALGREDEVANPGNLAVPFPANFGRSSWWAQFWTRTDFYISQGVTGISANRNFTIVRPPGGGPSIFGILGGTFMIVPTGPATLQRNPLFFAQMGRRTATSSSQQINTGAIIRAPNDGEAIDCGASATIPQGTLPAVVGSEWAFENQLGVIPGGSDSWKSWYLYGIGKTSLYRWEMDDISMMLRVYLADNQEWFASRINPLLDSRQRFCRTFPVDVTINGVKYALGIQWWDPDSNVQPEAAVKSVVSGIIHSIETVSTHVRRITIQRGIQFSSRTIAAPGSRPIEVEVRCATGGNFCQAPEHLQVLNARNQSYAHRGIKSRTRATEGHFVRIQGRPAGHLITDAKPYHAPPAFVDYRPEGSPSPTVWRTIPDQNLLRILPDLKDGESILFDPEPSGAFADMQVVWIEYDSNDAIVASGQLANEEFNDVPGYFPPDAQFSGPERYWYDPIGLIFRFPTGMKEFTPTGGGGPVKPNAFAVFWYLQAHAQIEVQPTRPLIVEAPGSGYDATGQADQVSLVWRDMPGNTTQAYLVTHGPGAMEYRESLKPDAAVVVVPWDADLSIADVLYREEEEAFSATSVDTPTGVFWLGFQRSGNNLNVRRSTDGVNYTTIATINVDALGFENLGFVSLASWEGQTPKVQGFEGLVSVALMDDETDLHEVTLSTLRFSESLKGQEFEAQYLLPVSESITQVRNITADTNMVESSTPARHRYRRFTNSEGSWIVFYSESVDDEIRVTHSAPASHGSPPGQHPNSSRQLNWATAGGVVSENRANYRDVIDIYVEHPDEFDHSPGEMITAYTPAVFDPRSAVVQQYDHREAVETNWEAFEGTNSRLYSVDGLQLISEAWLNERPEVLFSLRVAGKFFLSAGAVNPQMFKAMKLAVEALSKCWVRLPMLGGTAADMSGSAIFELAVSEVACTYDAVVDDTIPTIGAIEFGVANTVYEDLEADNFILPHWIQTAFGPLYRDTALRESAMNGFITCGVGGISVDEMVFGGDIYYQIYPYFAEASGNFYGAFPSVFTVENVPNINIGNFNFKTTPFNLGGILEDLPGGAMCLEATAEVKFTGLKIWRWSGSYSRHKNTNGDDVVITLTINDVMVYRLVIEDGVVNTGMGIDDWGSAIEAYDEEPAGTVSWRLIGRRRTAKVLQDFEGSSLNVLERNWQSVGGQITPDEGAVQDGEWRVVPITNLVNALLSDRGSLRNDYALIPAATSGISPTAPVGDLAAVLFGYLPAVSASGDVGTPISSARDIYGTATAAGQVVIYSTLEVRNPMGRFRLPTGNPGADFIPLQGLEARFEPS